MVKNQKAATASKVAIVAPAVGATVNVSDDLDAQIAALVLKKREMALAEIGGDYETVKAEIATGFAVLVKRADALKLAYNSGAQKFYAPWEIQAKRTDWPVREFILTQGKPQTAAQIAEGLDYETDVNTVQAVLDKDQKNTARKLFVQVGDKWWVASKSLPKN